MKIEDAINQALQNIAKYGDTDIFPFLFERHLFYDKPEECKDILLGVHADFDSALNEYPPSTHESLTQVGYTGFRWATQIEPFWNAYYLALVIYLADQIETKRIDINDKIVFSYRYKWDDAEQKLFSPSTWNDYKLRCIELSEKTDFVVLTDISDFYPRIYHHRIENELNRLPAPSDIPSRIMALLNAFSNNVSYGLPIGGPASRILSELALNSVDQHLRAKGITFCRYADDYTLFCKTRSDAYSALVFLSKILFNEGLVLQKNKTRILPSSEFYDTWKMLDPHNEAVSDEEKLLNISVRFDPYSETPEEDYENLVSAVAEVNIIGILAREIAKTAIDTTITKQAINAIRVLESPQQEAALKTLLDKENIDVLSPVFVTLMRAVRVIYDELPVNSKNAIDKSLLSIYENHDHILRVEVNLAYYLQALSKNQSSRKEEILLEIFDKLPSPIIRRIIITTMANWNCHYWLSDIKNRYSSFDEWDKRITILASYFLTDEGKHWRDKTKRFWGKREIVIRNWFSDRFQKQRNIPS